MKKIHLPDAGAFFEVIAFALEAFDIAGIASEGEDLEIYLEDELLGNNAFRAALQEIEKLLKKAGRIEEVPDKNWNALWESNFEPITLGREIRIRAGFHEPDPKIKYEIVINPMMSFGTGHHATTRQMLSAMLGHSFEGKKVLDMGCGTGVLSVLAEKLGAMKTDAIDHDPHSFENAKENARLNHCRRIRVLLGDESSVTNKDYDFILANINREVIRKQLPLYRSAIKDGGILISSGYLRPDRALILEAARGAGFEFVRHTEESDWLMMEFKASRR